MKSNYLKLAGVVIAMGFLQSVSAQVSTTVQGTVTPAATTVHAATTVTTSCFYAERYHISPM